VALFDYDGDGLLDIFATGGGTIEAGTLKIGGLPSRLYRNRGKWQFEDVTAQVGLDQPLFYSHGAFVTDIDNDGWPDLLVTGWNRVALYHNVAGPNGRRFVEISQQAGLTDTRWSTAAAWGDLDGDGFPDLYLAYYVDWSSTNNPTCKGQSRTIPKDVCPPQSFHPLRHRLYKNNGNRTFTDITEQAGLRPDGKGLGAIMLDLNGDGKNDVYVANDGGDNFLYLNQGGLKFKEDGRWAGVAVDDGGRYNGSMGVDAADYDGSGLPSLWVTNFQGEYHALYQHQRATVGMFQHATKPAGLARLGQQFVGFGTRFLDFDHDGWEDLVIAHGHVLRYPVGATMAQRPVLLHNEEHEGRRQFREVPGAGGAYFRDKHIGRGLAVGDLDNDGWPDIVISHQNQPLRLLRNVVGATAGRETHWLGVTLVDPQHRDLVGTKVTLQVAGRTLTKFVTSGASYLSSSDARFLFGMGGAQQGTVTVLWPNGETSGPQQLTHGTYHVIKRS
jgi:hypothetical protein